MEEKKTTSIKLKSILKRYFIDALGAMALGLFASLIVGLILSQISRIHIGNISFSVINQFADVAKSPYVVGAAIAVAIAWGLKHKPLVIFASAITGAYGYSLGGPVGAYVAGLIGAEIGGLVDRYASKIKLNIILTPLAVIIAGCFVGLWVGEPISKFMTFLGEVINKATTLKPFPMGILVAVLVGLFLTAPISSAALCIMLGLNGLAAGAATVGCCAQMVGFAVTSFKDNKWGGLLAQGVGTSMLQIPNIMKKPQILIAPTLAGAILGPIATVVLKMQNIPIGAGMGTAGLVGQFGTFEAMKELMPAGQLIITIILLHFVAPAILALGIHFIVKKLGWVKDGDMVININ
ncbi:MAG: PTS sugar transporter subunit IIC [Eubacteriales bacterium]